jgi:TfoX/Sxy family transcriptional regulator of competence genes
MPRSLEIMNEVCAEVSTTVRKMFGGHGFFAPHGGMFAGIVTDDEIVLKLQRGSARDELIALGGHPWTYDAGGKAVTMQEWIVVPDTFYDDLETFADWVKRAHRLAPPKAASTKAGPPKAKRPAKPQVASEAVKRKKVSAKRPS